MMKRLWRALRPLLFLLYLFVTTTFLTYSAFEFFPRLLEWVHLDGIRYYAQRAEYATDPVLVHVPRQPQKIIDLPEFRGDDYSGAYGFEAPPVRYHATYNEEGFRTNSSTPPVDVLVLGDSYVEIGESDDRTLPEILKQISGLSTYNLGRGWYGPLQYVELFKRYVAATRPRHVILCFFAGNDIEDTKQYLRWQKGGEGGDYYHFVLSRTNYLIRYLHALRDTYAFVRRKIQAASPPASRSASPGDPAHLARSSAVHPDIALVRLHDALIPMRFNYQNRPLRATALLQTQEWQAVRAALDLFKAVAAQHGIAPLVVYIPTKIQVYGRLSSEQSGERVLATMDEQVRFDQEAARALASLLAELDIPFIDLLPYFKGLAQQGKLLYYPFDSHWNVDGRVAAARVIAEALQHLPVAPARQ